MGYRDFFKQVTKSGQTIGFDPYPWQEQLSHWQGEAIAVVTAPTGAGKESGAVIPWLYAHANEKPAPTRLIYALPTRSLVDQVDANIRRIVATSELDIPVYCLKGGKIEHGFEQNLTQRAILVGTQDQLLSRALNRGFGVSWGQRPLHCAALTNDCRWILDEIQLTGVAYRTLVQLYQHWRSLGTYGRVELCLMSATFDDTPLQGLPVERFKLSDADQNHEKLGPNITRSKPVFQASVENVEDVAALARAKHIPGNLSLVVVNTVARARQIGELLKDLDPVVIHSRFLGIDREELQKRLYDNKSIIVATQVVEAGVDLDADLLITELCPWSSFVQRCGRCGRKRTENLVAIHWLDYRQGWKSLPYDDAECQETRDRLLQLTDANLDVLSKIPLPDLKLDGPPLFKSDVETFFCTHYVKRKSRRTAAQYVRDEHSFTVSVVWSAERPERLPHQKYTCPVLTQDLIDFCAANGITPMVWGEDDWEPRKPKAGDVVWLQLPTVRGYSKDVGWTGNFEDERETYPIEVEPQYNDKPSRYEVVLGVHLKDTEGALEKFIPHLQKLELPEALIQELCRCARWHDWGKAHPIWQAFARAKGKLLAKSPNYGSWHELNGYRHELASAFAAAAQGAPFLAQYLIAAHHGKVRDSLLPPHPNEDFKPEALTLRGVKAGMELPSFEIDEDETLPAVRVSFAEDAEDSWLTQLEELLEEYGPFRLIYLEALIRNADVKASDFREKETRHDSNRND
ncbi:MAG: CRISPR-associated helicase Cas3' [Leptolyngbya sp. SIO1D8]|nr:CRISPR-associated helicase Cas3' [Leptolyngbya sp. SIO1D8]